MENKSFNQHALLVAAIISALGTIVFGILWALIGTMSLFLGWVLGVVVGFINYGLIAFQTSMTISGDTRPFATILAGGGFFIRILLYGGAMFLSLLLWKKGYDVFNVFAVFGGFFPVRIGLYLAEFYERKKRSSKS
ncbi:MAG: hypothetical protein LKF69_05690 [Bacilli bacterium]|jgi:hypothetical protein|nr:hypothetical protein [Bacilli bacterium]MCH4236265.1 hypothetical protein [Bacilli bacterium]